MTDLRILSALIGLGGAMRTGVVTPDTGSVMLRGLAAYAGEEELPELVEAIHRERNAVSPDCAQCMNPCGNTSDFDLPQLQRRFEGQPLLWDLLRMAGITAERLLARGERSLPGCLERVPECAAWDSSEATILRLMKEMEAIT